MDSHGRKTQRARAESRRSCCTRALGGQDPVEARDNEKEERSEQDGRQRAPAFARDDARQDAESLSSIVSPASSTSRRTTTADSRPEPISSWHPGQATGLPIL